jgi:hypothetical protein
MGIAGLRVSDFMPLPSGRTVTCSWPLILVANASCLNWRIGKKMLDSRNVLIGRPSIGSAAGRLLNLLPAPVEG